MKAQCSTIVDMFIIELDKHFMHFELINPLFWMQLDADIFFPLHINIIKKQNCQLNKVKPSSDQVVEP
jgi:hypothetical protein